jgi:biopolymer transport protein ExbD
MKIRGARRNAYTEMNITSLIDIMLVLLIFFMVTTTFQRNAALKIDLPEASPKAGAVVPKTLELVIDSEGRFFVGRSELVNGEVATIQQALLQAANGDLKQPLTIRADARAAHKDVVRAMDAAGQAGFAALSIATTESQPAKR